MKRVVITGIGAVTAFGKTWEDVKAAFQRKQNAVQAKTEWAEHGEYDAKGYSTVSIGSSVV